MRNEKSQNRTLRRSVARQERGITLITTLLLLLLLMGMSLTMVLAVSSDTLLNGYYRNYRGSFYAADSGLNIGRQYLLDQLTASVPGTVAAGTQPIPTTEPATALAGLTSSYGTSYSSLNAGQAANSWPQKFQITSSSLTQTSCQVIGGGGTCTAPTGTPTAYDYVFAYSLTAVGQSSGTEAANITDNGHFFVNVGVAPTGPVQQSFAGWGMFIDQWTICSGSDLVPGTITGPVFTNGAWTFGSSGSYVFTDPVGSVSAKAGYDNGSCQQIAGASGNGITPTFQHGLNLGSASVPLPSNSYNQKQAVIDGIGNSSTNPTNATLNANLKNVSGTAYPSTGASSGVYLPYTTVSGVKTFTGGGIYVEGNATVTLSLPTNGNTTAQIYTIVQGSTTTTVTIDNGVGTTTIQSGSTTTTIQGVPVQKDPTTGAVDRDATMLYVDGNITTLSGPGAGQAAIQNDTALNITANGSVTVTGDILYKSEPVTFTQNQIPGTPADTLIPANNYGQVLGIFTATGNVNLANTQSSGNLEIDASIATISSGGSGAIVNTGNSINTLNIVGGRIQNTIQSIGATTRNVFFDRRFASNNFAPPWFPSTTVTQPGNDTTTVTATIKRTQWLNQSSSF